MPKDPPSLYRQYFTPAERRDLDGIPVHSGVASEINLLRIVLARHFASAPPPPGDLHSQLRVLAARANAAALIASLLRTQVVALNAIDGSDDFLEEVMVLFRATFGLPSPVSPLGEGPRARRPHTCPGSEAHREAAIAHPEPTRAQDSSPPGRGSEGPYTATPAMEKPT